MASGMKLPYVYIIDDDAAVRDGLGLLCETAGLQAVCYESAESFLEALRPNDIGCLVLDVRLGSMSGPELHAELNRRDNHMPIIYLTAYGDIPMTVKAIKAGAVDFLSKPVDGALLLERIKAVMSNYSVYLEHQLAQTERCQCLCELTTREREILRLVLEGLPSKAIARALAISYRTVEIHRSRILHKTGTTNLIELSRLAAGCGIEAGGQGLPGPDSAA